MFGKKNKQDQKQQDFASHFATVAKIGEPKFGVLPVAISTNSGNLLIPLPSELKGSLQVGDTLSFTIDMIAAKKIQDSQMDAWKTLYAYMQVMGNNVEIYRGNEHRGTTWTVKQPIMHK